ncbi:MAG: hypothetical protein KIT80_04655 [Chitinophagaceae bacterium]|nr:hypothetical protein [Chitinophagaceae bacterium]MCW5926182.1 hypothetical protein [Chitinophagaceae bacterium]
MKKLTLQLSGTLLLAVAILFSSCSKEGPAGPAGAAGPAGPAGATGAAGAAGPAGTANVIYSGWLDVEYEPELDDDDEVLAFWGEIPAPQLNQNILNTGEIKVYLNAGTPANPAVFALPLTDFFGITGILTINTIFTPNLIVLLSDDDASSFTDSNGAKRWQYRYILIPGGTAARKAGPEKDIDWNDYNAVKAYLNLVD